MAVVYMISHPLSSFQTDPCHFLLVIHFWSSATLTCFKRTCNSSYFWSVSLSNSPANAA